MAKGMSIEECYRILELEPGATLADLKSSWRLLSQIWHPDKHEAGSQAYKLAEKRQQALNEAYSQLTEYLQRNLSQKERNPQQAQPSASANPSANTNPSANANQQNKSARDNSAHSQCSNSQQSTTGAKKGSLDHIRFMAQQFTKAPESMSKAELEQWTLKAKNGDIDAQYFIGIACEFGLGGNKVDYNNAAFWYERAAGKGNAAAMYRLGHLYLYGNGVKQNYSTGIRYWKDAAQKGNCQAQMDLAMAYENGAWVQTSIAEARKYFSMAAASGDPVARQKLRELNV